MLQQHLLGTGDKLIVGASPYNTIWGVGLDAFHLDAIDPSRWRDQNLLGQDHPKVRRLIRDNTPWPRGPGKTTPPPSLNSRCDFFEINPDTQQRMPVPPLHTAPCSPSRRMAAYGRA